MCLESRGTSVRPGDLSSKTEEEEEEEGEEGRLQHVPDPDSRLLRPDVSSLIDRSSVSLLAAAAGLSSVEDALLKTNRDLLSRRRIGAETKRQ
ncbi:hypothetical protein F2P81_019703 [Scophthalmus maximus]|uniref:Uncharacterized protein n=1 Tax=Scophthalmus maximus TaxID=52904 RepID=A0A6A4S082_SCOMX|nr:hypothetical protein F2P81_019703 [Scophthalmus maximus]